MKNRISLFALFSAICLVIFSSCGADYFGIKGTGSVVTETRIASNFQNILLLTSANVEIVKSDTTYKVEVSDYENIIGYISVKASGKNLIISTSPANTLIKNSEAKVKITMPDSLNVIESTGSGNVTLSYPFKDLKLLMTTGSGSISSTGNLNLSTLQATTMGSGSISAEGEVTTLLATLSGSGSLKLGNLVATNDSCSLSGSGNIYTKATNVLRAGISGSGNIEYSGTAQVASTITGSGKLVKK